MSLQRTFKSVSERRGVRQFVKFALVGASSTFIALGVHWLLFKVIDGGFNDALRNAVFGMFHGLNRATIDPAFIIIKAISFITATFNGFYWNRRWTFRVPHGDRKRQLIKFYAVYIIGLLINTTVAAQIYHPNGGRWTYLVALFTATVVTTLWTFPANKFWTFKQESDEV